MGYNRNEQAGTPGEGFTIGAVPDKTRRVVNWLIKLNNHNPNLKQLLIFVKLMQLTIPKTYEIKSQDYYKKIKNHYYNKN